MSYRVSGVGRSGLFWLVAAVALCGCNNGGNGGGLGAFDPGSGRGEPLKDDLVAALPPLSVDPPSPAGGTDATVTVEAAGADSITLTATGDGCGGFTTHTVVGGMLVETQTVGAFGDCALTADATTGGVVTTHLGGFTVEPTALNLPGLRVLGGVFVPGNLPPAGVTATAITAANDIADIAAPGTLINGGTAQLRIQLADPLQVPDIIRILVKTQGAGGLNGYFEVPARVDGDLLVVELQLDQDFLIPTAIAARAALNPAAAAAGVSASVQVVSNTGEVSNPFGLSFLTQKVGTGDVQVSLSWDTATDVDLHVVEPSGEEIYWGHTGSATGGSLDLDSNAGCSIDGVNNENITWPVGQAPRGEYIVRVDFWEDCQTTGANFTVTATACGETQTVPGAFAPGSDDQGGAGSGIEVLRFDNFACQSRVRGTAKYEDRAQTATGLSATTTLLPIRFAQVEVQRASDNALLGMGETKQNGTFDISFQNDGAPGYKVIVMAKQDNAVGKQNVKDNTGSVYAVESDVIDETAEPDKTGLEIKAMQDAAGPAFNILDVGVTGNTLVRSAHGQTPPNLNWLWTRGQKGSCTNNVSCYQNAQSRISVLSIPADPDEYDDLVLLHEYGHFWQNNFSNSDSPGGAHSSRNRVDPQLAWGEGSATFFGNLAKGTSLYLDTTAAGVGVRNDIETLANTIPLGTSDNTLNGNLSEALVSAVLWDLSDGTNEAKDTLTKRDAVFDALGQLKRATTEGGTAGTDLVDFLDAWFCRGHGNRGTATTGVEGNVVGRHQVNYDFPTLDSCR